MRHLRTFALGTAVVLGATAPLFADAVGPDTDPVDITAGKLAGYYKGTLTVGSQAAKEVKGKLTSSAPNSAVLTLGWNELTLTRKIANGENHLVGNKGFLGSLGQTKSKIDLKVVDWLTLEGTIVDQGTSSSKTTKVRLVRTPNPPRTAAELEEFDAGPPAEVQALFDQIPKAYEKYFPYMWWRFGPVFYRGRLDKSARLMIIGSDPGPTECLPYVRRGFIGDSGQRVQGLLTKIGLTKSYVTMNSFAYALFPSASNEGKGEEVNNDPEIVAWRNKVYSAAVGPNLQAIVIFGFQGKRAYDLWTNKPNVPMLYLPHPSRFDGEPDSNLIPRWRDAVTRLRKIVTPDDANLAKAPNYGEEFTELDFSPIPRRDLPKGATINGEFVKTPDHVGDDSWTRIVPIHNIASRPKPDNGKDLIVTAPDGTKTRVRATPNTSGKQSDPPTWTSTPF